MKERRGALKFFSGMSSLVPRIGWNSSDHFGDLWQKVILILEQKITCSSEFGSLFVRKFLFCDISVPEYGQPDMKEQIRIHFFLMKIIFFQIIVP